MILIVEDDIDIRETLTDVFERSGYRTASAVNGQDACDFLQKSPEMPKLILLDLMMPVMDGFGFREQQLKNPKWKDIPVLVVTAGGNAAQKAEQMGVKNWLQKPIALEALLDKVGELLSPDLQ